MKIEIENIKKLVPSDAEIIGNTQLVFSGMQSVMEAEQTDITWIKPSLKNAGELINETNAGAIICDHSTLEFYTKDRNDKLFIVTKEPKIVFVDFVKYINASILIKPEQLVHPTAIIDPDCRLGTNVRIGAYSIVGACSIGDNSVIHEYVKVYDRVSIEKNCLIREFCSIGGAGFGYLKNTQQENDHIPHIGTVVIGDNVHIYPYSNVDRGTLGKTEIKQGTVIDHYVHIGHNTLTGKNNIITAGTVLAGGSSISDNCFIGVHTIVKEKCKIGSNVITGMGSVIIKDIPSNTVVAGNPAKFLRDI